MMRAPITALMLLTIALAGCMEPTDDGGGDTTDPGDTTYTITVTQVPGEAAVGTAFMIEWTVETSTSGQRQVPHVGSHWAYESVPDPQTPGDYGNNAGVVAPAMVPGTFTAEITPPEAGTLYLRAHVIADDAHWWSQEHSVEVSGSGGGTGGQQTVHTVRIGVDTSCTVADYEPATITISAGDAVEWMNEDSCPHTATPDGGPDGTGNIPAGDTSDPVTFDEAGTYAISCDYHPQMSGEVVVE
jgi:plastocyanin